MTRILRLPAVPFVALLAASVPFVSACDSGFVADTPSNVCSEAGVQCRLATGPLGVCEQTRCDGHAVGPCFACISQH